MKRMIVLVWLVLLNIEAVEAESVYFPLGSEVRYSSIYGEIQLEKGGVLFNQVTTTLNALIKSAQAVVESEFQNQFKQLTIVSSNDENNSSSLWFRNFSSLEKYKPKSIIVEDNGVVYLNVVYYLKNGKEFSMREDFNCKPNIGCKLAFTHESSPSFENRYFFFLEAERKSLLTYDASKFELIPGSKSYYSPNSENSNLEDRFLSAYDSHFKKVKNSFEFRFPSDDYNNYVQSNFGFEVNSSQDQFFRIDLEDGNYNAIGTTFAGYRQSIKALSAEPVLLDSFGYANDVVYFILANEKVDTIAVIAFDDKNNQIILSEGDQGLRALLSTNVIKFLVNR